MKPEDSGGDRRTVEESGKERMKRRTLEEAVETEETGKGQRSPGKSENG